MTVETFLGRIIFTILVTIIFFSASNWVWNNVKEERIRRHTNFIYCTNNYEMDFCKDKYKLDK